MKNVEDDDENVLKLLKVLLSYVKGNVACALWLPVQNSSLLSYISEQNNKTMEIKNSRWLRGSLPSPVVI